MTPTWLLHLKLQRERLKHALGQELPGGHPLQLWAWGEVKRLNGWTTHRLVLTRDGMPLAAGQLLLWRLSVCGRTIAYLPRGPLGAPAEARAFRRSAAAFARARGALCPRIEPAWTEALLPLPWRAARDRILLPHTYTLNLRQDENALWAELRSKTWQYIRTAENRGVVTRDAGGACPADVRRIYAATAARGGFALHTDAYYRRVRDAFDAHNCLYCALIDGRAEALL